MSVNDSKIDEIIISMIKGNSIIYDKSLEKYHTEYRKERLECWEAISQAIFQIYEVHMSEKDIENRWSYLMRKFKEESAKSKSYNRSGSERQKENTWIFFDDMIWLQPYIEHLPQVSSDNFNEDTSNCTTENKFRKKRKAQDDMLEWKALMDENSKVLKNIEEVVNKPNLNENNKAINNFMAIIKNGFNLVPEKQKYTCCRQIISYVHKFKINKNL